MRCYPGEGGVHYKRPYTKLFSFFFAAFFGIFAAMHNTIRNKVALARADLAE